MRKCDEGPVEAVAILPPPSGTALKRDVRVRQSLMARNLDLEIRSRIAVDVAFNDREVSIGPRLVAHSQLSGRREQSPREKREGLICGRSEVGIDGAEVETIARLEPENGI